MKMTQNNRGRGRFFIHSHSFKDESLISSMKIKNKPNFHKSNKKTDENENFFRNLNNQSDTSSEKDKDKKQDSPLKSLLDIRLDELENILGVSKKAKPKEEPEEIQETETNLKVARKREVIFQLLREDLEIRKRLSEHDTKSERSFQTSEKSKKKGKKTKQQHRLRKDSDQDEMNVFALFPLETLQPENWDFPFPTLISNQHPQGQENQAEQALCRNVQEFQSNLFHNYPFLQLVDWKQVEHCVVIAGGSVCANLWKTNFEPQTNPLEDNEGIFKHNARDIDLFFHSISKLEAEKTLKFLHKEFLAVAWLHQINSTKQKIFEQLKSEFQKWKTETRISKKRLIKKKSLKERINKTKNVNKIEDFFENDGKENEKDKVHEIKIKEDEKEEEVEEEEEDEEEGEEEDEEKEEEEKIEEKDKENKSEQESEEENSKVLMENCTMSINCVKLYQKMRDPTQWTLSLLKKVVKSLRFRLHSQDNRTFHYDEKMTLKSTEQESLFEFDSDLTYLNSKPLEWVSKKEKLLFLQNLDENLEINQQGQKKVNAQRSEDDQSDEMTSGSEEKQELRSHDEPENETELETSSQALNLYTKAIARMFWTMVKNQKHKNERAKEIAKKSFISSFQGRVELFQMRNGSCLSFVFPKSNLVQIMFRLYPSIENILRGFDLSSSAVAYDTKNVWFTNLSKWSFEHRAIILDSTHRSPLYELRLQKYFKAPFFFSLVCPFLDMKKLKTANLKWNLSEVLDLPTMPIAYKQISGQAIFVQEFLRQGGIQFELREGNNDKNEVHEMSFGEFDKRLDYFQEEAPCFERNIQVLLKKDQESPTSRLLFSSNTLDEQIFQKKPEITPQGILRWYKQLEKNLCNRKLIKWEKLRQFFNFEDPLTLCQLLWRAVTQSNLQNVLKAICDRQAKLLLEQYNETIGVFENRGETLPLPWIQYNAGAQFESSSLEPLPTQHEDFYGDFFHEGTHGQYLEMA